MANNGRPTFAKRQKELARKQNKEDKRARAEKRQTERDNKVVPEGVDPDIAGIVPGPQPRPWDD